MQRHEFAFYTPLASHIKSAYKVSDTYDLDADDDWDLIKRITQIVRAEKDDTLIFFDEQAIVKLKVQNVEKKQSVTALVLVITTPVSLKPVINWIVPLLEREPFEEALAFLTVLGATNIYPVTTQKTHRTAIVEREWERIKRIMIAAAEQSKQFVFPIVHPITDLSILLEKKVVQPALFFDPNGRPVEKIMQEIMCNLNSHKDAVITCMVGPEGDLTIQEKQLLQDHSFIFCALTPSVLRSQHAIMVSMGMLRSMLSSFDKSCQASPGIFKIEGQELS